jgi:hypothetical protein
MVWLCFNRGEEEVIGQILGASFGGKGLEEFTVFGSWIFDEEDNGSCRVIVQMHAPHTRYTLIQKRYWLHYPMVLLHTYSNIYPFGIKYNTKMWVPRDITRSKISF